MLNRTIGRYKIVERIGRGGMAEVYRAYHVSLDRYVAIKVLHTFLAEDPEFKGRFEKEAQSIARLKHPHIVQVYDFDFDSAAASYYMVMELINGPTLKDRLFQLNMKQERMAFTEVLRIVREAATALAYAHSLSMIHRDVKPANLMLDEGKRVVLTDFGIAKIVTGQQYTVTGGMVGTPAYMAPEQGMGDTGDERSDLYSLGVMLFEMLAGRLPFDAETPVAMILKHLHDPVPSVVEFGTSLPSTIDLVVGRLMAKNPEDRYQTADDLINDLDAVSSGQPLSARKRDVPPLPSQMSTAYFRQPTPVDDADTLVLKARPNRPIGPPPELANGSRRAIPRWAFIGSIVTMVIAAVGGYWFGTRSGASVVLEASDTPTVTYTSTATVTLTSTLTPSATSTFTMTPTLTDTLTLTSTVTLTPTSSTTPTPTLTITPTPRATLTPSASPDFTGTAVAARTATVAACKYDYAIVEQTPREGTDGGFFPAKSKYTRTILLLNSGTCAWEPNTSLTFVEGEDFDAGPRIFIRHTVEPAATVTLTFEGTLPAKGSQMPVAGKWELRTPGQIPIGQPMTISVLVYESS